MRYHFKINKERGGFWATCLEIPGCLTQGDSKEELLENMQDALNTYLEEPENSMILAPLPDTGITSSRSIAEISVDPKVAFGFLVRYHRIKNGLTQKDVAKKLGMKNIFSYQRLEKSSNVTLEIIGKFMQLYPTFPFDKVFN